MIKKTNAPWHAPPPSCTPKNTRDIPHVTIRMRHSLHPQPTKQPLPRPQMAFSVHPATPSDIPALASVSLAAFDDDPIVGYLARDVPPDILYAYQCQQFRRRFDGSELTGLRVFKVVEGATGCVGLLFFS